MVRCSVDGVDENGDTTVLHESDSINDAARWARGYVRHGDYGGWAQIQLVDLGAPAGGCILRTWTPDEEEREG